MPQHLRSLFWLNLVVNLVEVVVLVSSLLRGRVGLLRRGVDGRLLLLLFRLRFLFFWAGYGVPFL